MPVGPRPDPPSRTIKGTFNGRAGTAPWSNVMWFAATGAGEIAHADLISLADGLFGAWTSNISAQQSTSSSLDLVEVVLWQDGDEFSANSSHVSVAGSSGGIMLPANCAACISWPIAPHYRGGHPRTYVAGIPASAMFDSTTFQLAYSSALTADARAFHTAVETLGPFGGITTVEHGIVSFVHANAWRTPPVFRHIQSDAFVDRRLDSQRRRLGRDVA